MGQGPHTECPGRPVVHGVPGGAAGVHVGGLSRRTLLAPTVQPTLTLARW